MSNTVGKVKKERETPTYQQDLADWRIKAAHVFIIGRRARGGIEEPARQHNETDAHRNSGRPVQN